MELDVGTVYKDMGSRKPNIDGEAPQTSKKQGTVTTTKPERQMGTQEAL